MMLSLTGHVDLSAQSDAKQVAKRLEAVEAAVRALEKQVTELGTMLRSALPPPPFADIPAVDVKIGDAAAKGAAGAKRVLIEYSDFECPFCGRHAQSVYREIQKQYVDSGRVKYVFRNLPLEQIHPSARKAAEAAECAREQGKFWEFHDRLFANQKALTPADMSNYARIENLDVSKFESCVASGNISRKISDEIAEATRLDLRSTPAFLIGELTNDGTVRITRRISGAQSFSVFQAALDKPLGTP
jgi:protein-disulfide isomerase